MLCLLLSPPMPGLRKHGSKGTTACFLSLETKVCPRGITDIGCVQLFVQSAYLSASLSPTLHLLVILPPGPRTKSVPVYYQVLSVMAMGIVPSGRYPSHVLLE